MREEMFYIFQNYTEEAEPLYWGEKVLEFETEESARAFIDSAIENGEAGEDFFSEVVIKRAIVYNDDGYINATNMRVANDGTLVCVVKE